tara:strand:+ start:122 stop:268 length:147 start_codon:yes stop_codon:yes gene_type:complete
MKDALKLKKTKPPFEINWKIREIFSEAALSSFFDEVDNEYHAIKQNKI